MTRPVRPESTSRSVGRVSKRVGALQRRDVGGTTEWVEFEEPYDNDWEWPGGTAVKPAWKLNPNPGKHPFLRGAVLGGVSGTSPFTLPDAALVGAPFDGDFITALALTTEDGIAITKIDGAGIIYVTTFTVGAAGDVSIVDADGNFTAGNVEDALAELAALISGLSSVYQAKDTTLDTYGGIDPSSNVQSILGAANYAAIRTLLALVVGTNVQAWDADLDAFAGLAIAADKLPYGTGSHTLGLTDLSSFIRTLLDDADAATARATLGVTSSNVPFTPTGTISSTNVQAAIAEVASEAGGGGGGGSGTDIVSDVRTTNTLLGTGDKGKVILAQAAYTQTFDAAATLGVGWSVWIKNDTPDGTTVLVVNPNGSETIDGLTTITMYSGETRLIECDGSNFTSQLLSGGFARFTSSGSFVVPAGVTWASDDIIAGGSSGGGGRGGAAASTRKGGSAAGGSARDQKTFTGAALGTPGTSITVTVGAGGTGGAGGSSANGSNGGTGGVTSFGTLHKVFPGGKGIGGETSTTTLVGGGGGGVGEAGADGILGSNLRGGNNIATGQGGSGGQGAGNLLTGSTNLTRSAEWGGGAGSGSGTAGTSGAGGSIHGSPGAGGGGSVTSANAAGVGGEGGSVGEDAWTALGGGGTAGSTGGGAGGDGAAGNDLLCGEGGGGGGGNTAGTGGKGGNGGIPGGPGAGGGGGTTTGGAGGDGGRGECRVWYG